MPFLIEGVISLWDGCDIDDEESADHLTIELLAWLEERGFVFGGALGLEGAMKEE